MATPGRARTASAIPATARRGRWRSPRGSASPLTASATPAAAPRPRRMPPPPGMPLPSAAELSPSDIRLSGYSCPGWPDRRGARSARFDARLPGLQDEATDGAARAPLARAGGIARRFALSTARSEGRRRAHVPVRHRRRTPPLREGARRRSTRHRVAVRPCWRHETAHARPPPQRLGDPDARRRQLRGGRPQPQSLLRRSGLGPFRRAPVLQPRPVGADKTLSDMLRLRLAGGREPWPASYPSPFADAPPQAGRGPAVTLVGHASLLIQIAGLNILTDPVWSQRASPFALAGPKRVNPPGIAFDDLPPIDACWSATTTMITSTSDARAAEAARRAALVVPLGNDAVIRGTTMPHRAGTARLGRSASGSARTSASTSCRRNHWSARGAGDRRMALWSGFVIDDAGRRALLRRRHRLRRRRDLPRGARRASARRGSRSCRSAPTSRAGSCAAAHEPGRGGAALSALGAGRALGNHWGTFRLTDERIEQPLRDSRRRSRRTGCRRERFRPLRPARSGRRERFQAGSRGGSGARKTTRLRTT